MAIYHIVLFKLKPGVSPGQVTELTRRAQAMVGKVPGLRRIDLNGPLASTAARGQGFNMGLVAILDKADDVKVYADHPAHQEVQEVRLEICDDTIAFDLEYTD